MEAIAVDDTKTPYEYSQGARFPDPSPRADAIASEEDSGMLDLESF